MFLFEEPNQSTVLNR
ncbi:hypothetical protein LINPERPRIM_LOCUS45048 [Linum perenne]